MSFMDVLTAVGFILLLILLWAALPKNPPPGDDFPDGWA